MSDAETERQARIARVMEHRATVDATYRAYAIDQAYEKICDIERGTVTPAMKRIEAEDPDRHLAGLGNSLKGRDRLTEKVIFDVQKKGVTVEQAVANVKDAIRYTFCYSEDAYTEGVYADCDRLADKGFELVERRNSWDKEQYKGINSRWRVPANGSWRASAGPWPESSRRLRHSCRNRPGMIGLDAIPSWANRQPRSIFVPVGRAGDHDQCAGEAHWKSALSHSTPSSTWPRPAELAGRSSPRWAIRLLALRCPVSPRLGERHDDTRGPV